MTVVTPTDRSKAVRNRCEIEGFGGVFCCLLNFIYECYRGGGVVMGLGLISSFFSYGQIFGKLYFDEKQDVYGIIDTLSLISHFASYQNIRRILEMMFKT